MSFSAAYTIIPELNLLIDVRKGDATIERLMAYKNELIKAKGYNENLVKLVDTRLMNWDCTISDISDYINLLSQLKGGLSQEKKAAGIYNSMHQLAYTYAINKAFTKAGQKQKFFTEIAPALHWLNIDIDPQKVEEIIQEIIKKPQFIW